MKIVVDENIPFLKGELEPYFDEVVRCAGDRINHETILDASALIIRTRTNCNAELLKGTKVEFIGSATIGSDHVDTDYCLSEGIEFVNAPGCNSGGVQQWVLVAILEWAAKEHVCPKGLTLGVVGVGNVGSKVAASAEAMGMNVLCCDPPRKRNEKLSNFVSLEYLVANSDIITFHVPLIRKGCDATYHLINKNLLSACKANIFLINSSRGEVGCTADIVDFALKNESAQFAFDVWENEPNISADLLKRSLIATPHIAGYSYEGKVNGTRMVVDALNKHFGLSINLTIPRCPNESQRTIPPFLSVAEAIRFTYPIVADDIRTIKVGFEQFRNTYAYRSDFSGYKYSSSAPDGKTFKTLGFSTE